MNEPVSLMRQGPFKKFLAADAVETVPLR